VVGRRRPAEGPATAAYLGAPRRYKGFDLLPAIIAATDPERVRWLVYSHATDGDQAEAWAELHRLEGAGRVELCPKEVDVRLAYERCDVVVCPSRRDSFCRVAAEAMLNGIPVVGTDIDPIRALLGPDGSDGRAGILVPVEDPAAVAEAVSILAADAGFRRRLGDQGRQRAAAFDPASVVAALSDLYGVTGPGQPASGPAPTAP
jgi:glycosyltransferase involved in cell wall biosynthesis